MIDCCLMKRNKFGSRSELEFNLVENFYESNHFNVCLCNCEKCGQPYIGCFVKLGDEEGEVSWTYWTPVNNEDIEFVRNDPSPDNMSEFLQIRKHIVYGPSNKIFWSEGTPLGIHNLTAFQNESLNTP